MKRLVALGLLAVLVVSLLPALPVGAQTPTPPQVVERLLADMSPEERVGQLFLVTFRGTLQEEQPQILDLITEYHVGGIVLLAANDNFTASPTTIPDLHRVISQLQLTEWNSSTGSSSDPAGNQTYVPLFIGIEQDGNGYPGDQILNGLTPMPSAMSLGATWLPDLVQNMGEIQGQELSALGINLYLGPSLDVLETPIPTARGDIGTHSFGGDPFWVGEMGQAFITGLHNGSQGKMLVVAKHFPGGGGSDRPLDLEVATVRKTLEQLKQIELAPFFAVTGKASNALATADALLISHIRYQGLQGNIRATTRPISFDQAALGEMLALKELSTWHKNGGLLVSDDLGSQAVASFFSQTDTGISPQLIARDAFMAGNDVLYLGNLKSEEAESPYQTAIDVLNFFTQRYNDDPGFAQDVDQAVKRILLRKYQLYGQFDISSTVTAEEELAKIGQLQQPIFEVARRSATLISPDVQELASVFPAPPASRDRIVFITDTSQYRQCSSCPLRFDIHVNALQDAVIRLYGTAAGGPVLISRLASYSFEDLSFLLDRTESETLRSDILRANWIVISISDASLGQPEVVSQFLSERQDLLRDKRIVLFAFSAPYYFDATDISKLTAYYGLYSKQPAFIEVAARLLYQELTPLGNSPVSIPGTGYDLIKATSPDPNQVITLILDNPPATNIETSTPPVTVTDQALTIEPTPVSLFNIGDTIFLQTSEILDHNDHIVPDGTVVRFTMLLTGESGGILQQIDQETERGVARASFKLESPGLVEIRASSEPANISNAILIDVSANEPAAVTVVPPFTPEPATPTVTPTPIVEDRFITPDGFPRLNSWLLTLTMVAVSALLAYWVGSKLVSQRAGVRWALFVLLGGLLGYNYIALGLPGSAEWTGSMGIMALLGLTFVGEMVGLVAAWLWPGRS